MILQLRKLQVSDADSMYQVERRCFTVPWTEAQCRAALAQSAFAALGFFNGHDLVAYISYYHAADEMEIANLAVLSENRRQGLGRRLLHTVLQLAQKIGIAKIWLEVRPQNIPAISLYRNCGFFEYSRRPHYYPDTGEDALIFLHRLKS